MTKIVGDSSSGFDQLPWQSSADQAGGDEEAVEVAFLDPTIAAHAECIKALEASHSYGKVEIRVLVRNSQEPQNILAFTMAEWEAFVLGAKDGEFDLDDTQSAPEA